MGRDVVAGIAPCPYYLSICWADGDHNGEKRAWIRSAAVSGYGQWFLCHHILNHDADDGFGNRCRIGLVYDIRFSIRGPDELHGSYRPVVARNALLVRLTIF